MGPIKGLLVATLTASVLLCATASIAASPADTPATHTLLQARYELDVAFVHNLPASQAGSAKLAARIGRECHAALAREPTEGGLLPLPGAPVPTPRAIGERARGEHQRLTIDEEIGRALGDANAAPNRAAIEAYVAAAAPLSWSDARIAPLVRADATRLQESVRLAPPDVCADIKAWAQSGYRILSPASRAFQSTRGAREEQVNSQSSLDALLKPFEGAAELAILRRTSAVHKRLASMPVQSFRVFQRLAHALGVPENPSQERRRAPTLGHGTTNAGETFTIHHETAKGSLAPSCRHAVSVELTEETPKGGAIVEGSSESGPVCLSTGGDKLAASSCSGNVASITVAVPASVRTVRLRLSDGSAIGSAVVRIPRKDGGPAGVYVQAVRGYARQPVSLTELDANGQVVREMKLRGARCKRESHRHPTPPTFVDLVKGVAPGGQPFTIQGVLVEFGTHRDFSVTAGVGTEGGGEEGPGDVAVGGSGAKKAFPWSRIKGCPPRPFALLYGILEAPGDSVLVRTPEGLVPLTKLALAANLRAGGPLVYGAFSSFPSELIVRRVDGSTLYSESLAAKAKEDAEFCEGLAES